MSLPNDPRLLTLTCAASESCGGAVRDALSAWFTQPLSDELRNDALLAATELFTNAIRYTAPGDPVVVHVRDNVDDVTITVTDTGPGFETGRIAMPDADQIRGRGLAILRALGHLRIEHHHGATSVQVTLAK